MRDVVRPLRFASSPICKMCSLQLDLQLDLKVRVMAVQERKDPCLPMFSGVTAAPKARH
jgi:hypothetical protein